VRVIGAEVVARWVRGRALHLGLFGVVLAGGCAGGTSAEDGSVAAAYQVAVEWLVEEGGDPGAPLPERVFIEAVGEDGIPLEVQAELVNELQDLMAVRFIDAREEAIELTEPGDPIREGGVLLGLGDVDADRSPVRLYADRYRDVHDVVAYELLLERRGRTWRLAEEPREVPVADERGLGG